MKTLIAKFQWFFFRIFFFKIWESCHLNMHDNYYRIGEHKISAEFLKMLSQMAHDEEVIELGKSDGVITFKRILIEELK